MSACRPIESTINILTILKKEALVLGRERADDARDRRRRNVPCYAYYEGNPMIQLKGEDDDRPAFQMSDARGGDATLEGDVEMKEVLQVPLKDFLVKYHSEYVTDSSAASHTKYYPRNGKKPELIVNKQFARDAPSILRINGQEPAGEGEEEQVRAAYHALVQAVGGSTEKAQRVSVVANQNLGVCLFEHVVNKFADDSTVSVMQAGQHHVDIRTSRRGVVVVFVALFRLQPNDADEQRGDLVKGSVRVDYIKKQVSVQISDAQTAQK
uniref:Uncharacterized protein n=1 Tax=Hemiselmis andersenii TaxID=464988 RepID=A0A7S1HG52_HEMAN